MKAAVYTEYGSPDVVHIAEIEKPVPRDDEVLIKVRAASVNPLDWRVMTGKPRITRILARLLKMEGRPGRDVAGQVEAVGRNVTQFKPGDEIFGSCAATIAEYTCARQSAIVAKPEGVSFEQAAAIPVAGLTALQGLRHGKIQHGEKVLINGAAGGVGTFAVQIARTLGAHVTGVCSTRNLDLVRSLGAAESIDYTQRDFTTSDQRYDVILECAGNVSFSQCRRVLNPKGRYVMVGAPHDASMIDLLALMTKPLLQSAFSTQKAIMFMAKLRQDDLTYLAELIVSGKLKPVIDHSYSLSEARDAVRHVEAGHARGKVIVCVNSDA